MPLMRDRVSSVGRAEYNGFNFGGMAKTKSIRVTPVYDRAGRTVIYNTWHITLQTYVTGLTSTTRSDPVIQDMVNRLEKPGGTFYFEGRGIGNQTVNLGQAGLRDVKWGPKPDVCEIEPTGRGFMCKVTWSVSFCIPNCVNARYMDVPLELSYTVSHETDDAGMTTRVLSGSLTIPMTRTSIGDRLPNDCADQYRDQVTPKKVPGFRRSFGPWVVNEDRTNVTFSFTDTEMGRAIPPKGVIEVSFSHTLSSSQVGLMNWQGNMAAAYRMKKTKSGYDAAKYFWDQVTASLAYSRDALKKLPDKAELIPTGYSAGNANKYGKTHVANFSLAYTFVCQLKNLLGVGGLWQPTVNSNYEEWSADLASDAWNPYGGAKLYFRPGDDYIVDACDPNLHLVPHTEESELRQSDAKMTPGGEEKPSTKSDRTFESELRGSAGNIGIYSSSRLAQAFPKPSAANSWIYYENELFLEVDNGLIPIKVIPRNPISLLGSVLSGQRGDFVGPAWNGLLGGGFPSIIAAAIVGATGAQVQPSFEPPLIVPGGGNQLIAEGLGNGGTTSADAAANSGRALRRVPGSIFIYMRGHAIRAGYRVDPPRLTRVNDVVPEPANRLDRGEGYAVGMKANGLHPFYIGRWNLRYYLPKEPTGLLPLPPNPILGSGDPASSGTS